MTDKAKHKQEVMLRSKSLRKEKTKKLLRNKWVRRYFKAVEKMALGIIFFISACWPICTAIELNDGWWLLGIIFTWPLAYLCGYRIFEEWM